MPANDLILSLLQTVPPPPPPPSPSSLQAWQWAVPVPLAVVLGRIILPKYLPFFNERWLCQQSPPGGSKGGGGARRRKNLSSTWTPWQASTTAVITNWQCQTSKTNPPRYQAEEPWQEGADWLCGETGAYAPFLVLLRTYKPSQRELLSLILNGTRWHHTLKVWHALVPHGARGIYLWHEFRNGLLLQLKFHYWLDSAPRCLWWMFKDRVGCLPYYRIIWHPGCRYDRQWQPTAPYGFIKVLNFQMAINLIVKCIMVSPHVLCVCDWCPRTQ